MHPSTADANGIVDTEPLDQLSVEPPSPVLLLDLLVRKLAHIVRAREGDGEFQDVANGDEVEEAFLSGQIGDVMV